MADIKKMQSRKMHPMLLKMELAQRIVKDFHSTEAATAAMEDWSKQFQQGAIPTDIKRVEIPYIKVEDKTNSTIEYRKVNVNPAEVIGIEKYYPIPSIEFVASLPGARIGWVKLDKLLFESGLAGSVSEASRKIREHAVKVESKPIPTQVTSLLVEVPSELTVSLGKRMLKVSIL
jgi:tyrosyl-tRNA synthetase